MTSDFPKPVIGFCAYSGTGKTTLLRQLIPLLKQQGLRIAVIKHSHHDFEIDYPGKDSYELRAAGADQLLIASRQRMAWIREVPEHREEPDLDEALSALQADEIDLVLVEGFRHLPLPKIELHRPSRRKPLIYPDDASVIAIASDAPLPDAPQPMPPLLDMNAPAQVAEFILQYIGYKQA